MKKIALLAVLVAAVACASRATEPTSAEIDTLLRTAVEQVGAVLMSQRFGRALHASLRDPQKPRVDEA
jgi:hypothetical protein